MSSQGAVHVSPILGNTGSGQRGSGHLAVPLAAWWPDSEPVFKPYARGGTRLRVNQRRRGVLRTSASTTLTPGKIRRGKARVSSWTREIRPSRIIGGPPETWPWWNWEPALQSKERGR